MVSAAERSALRRAVELAARGFPRTLPNPAVGCVVLAADEMVVGEGWHEYAGGPHAEVVALAAAGERAAGGTAVVTLEPCAHTGRTGPCTQALLAAGVHRVVIGVADPSAAAAGGAARLRAAGVAVEQVDGAERAAAESVDVAWLTAVRRGRPYLTWKLASSLDGRIAAADRTSRWITGADARADVHRLRAWCDAILVGVGTVLADDPSLTVRPADGPVPDRQPLRVVADTHGRTPSGARVRDAAAPTWIATAADVGTGSDGRLDLGALMSALHERERRHVLLEGGPRLAGAAVAAGLVDRVVAYVAPALLGSGASALGPAGVTTLAQAYRLELLDVRVIGDDVRIEARPLPRDP